MLPQPTTGILFCGFIAFPTFGPNRMLLPWAGSASRVGHQNGGNVAISALLSEFCVQCSWEMLALGGG